VAEEHEAVDKVRADKAGATGDEDALALGIGEEADGGELGKGGVLDLVRVLVVDRLGAVVLRGRADVGGLGASLDEGGGKVEGAEGLGVDTRVEAVAVVADLVDGLGRGDLVGLGLAGYRGAEVQGEVEARGNARGWGGGRDKGMEGLDGVGSWLVRAPDGAGDDGDVCGCRLADEEGGGRRIACAL
jgi:hypothetical protein